MRKLFSLTAHLFLLGISVLCVPAQTSLTTDAKQKTFDKVWQTVNEKFFDPHFNGVDWSSIKDRYSPRVGLTKTDAEFYELLNQMLAQLKTSHMDVVAPESLAKLKQPAATTGLGLRELGGLVVITRVLPDSSAAAAGLKSGFVLKSIDGQSLNTVDDAKRLLSGPPGSVTSVIYLDGKDEPKTVPLRRVALNSSGSIGGGIKLPYLFTSERLKDGIGYIRFSSWVDTVAPRITAAIRSMKGAPGIIIDLRGNGGGDDDVAINLANMLFDKETQLMVTRTRAGDDLYYKAKPVKDPYLGPVVILVDELSGSASEQFAAGMQETGRAYVIGKTTAGDDMDADLEKLPSGAILIYAAGQPRTPKGIVIEGRGVIPNREVGLTRAELLSGKDAQIDAAVEYIEAKMHGN